MSISQNSSLVFEQPNLFHDSLTYHPRDSHHTAVYHASLSFYIRIDSTALANTSFKSFLLQRSLEKKKEILPSSDVFLKWNLKAPLVSIRKWKTDFSSKRSSHWFLLIRNFPLTTCLWLSLSQLALWSWPLLLRWRKRLHYYQPSGFLSTTAVLQALSTCPESRLERFKHCSTKPTRRFQ